MSAVLTEATRDRSLTQLNPCNLLNEFDFFISSRVFLAGFPKPAGARQARRAVTLTMAVEQDSIPFAAVSTLGPGKALVFAPHPDDEVFGCGGAIMRHLEAGDPVKVVVVTDGGFRGEGLEPDPGDVDVRRAESTAAAAILGCDPPEFWGLPDRGLEYAEPLVRRILETIGKFGADLVYAPSLREMHPDHVALGLAVAEAVRRNGGSSQLVLYEIGVPLAPNRLLDITSLAARKRVAMECFVSQLRVQNYVEHVSALNRFRSYTLPPSVASAEAFYVAGDASSGTAAATHAEAFYQHAGARSPVIQALERPLVTVIIRSMGRAQLSEALDSVAVQTYANVEVVVVNALGELHPSVPSNCGRFPLRSTGKGAPLDRSQAANLGLDAAKGDYLIFLDDDDIFFPDHLHGLVTAARNAGWCDAVYAGIAVEHYQDGELVGTGEFNEAFDGARLKAENYIPMHALLFSRRMLERGCRFDEDLGRYEDWDFWLQLLRFGPFVHHPAVSACYRSHGSSGFGLAPDDEVVRANMARFLDKWRHLWSGEELREILTWLKARTEPAETQWKLQVAFDQQAKVLEALKSGKQEIQEQLAALQQRYLALQAREEESQRLQAEFRDILNSRSWRLTRPLRWFKRLARR